MKLMAIMAVSSIKSMCVGEQKHFSNYNNGLTKLIIISNTAMIRLLCLTGTPPLPTIGDIRLEPYTGDPELAGFFEVLVYYTDGTQIPTYRGICSDNSYREEAVVICRQLGYAYGGFTSK